mgnify:FL=1
MGRGELDKKKDEKVEATLCPTCSFEHVTVPMFRIETDLFHCLLCQNFYEKRVNGRTVFTVIEDGPDVEFEADFKV